jgi:hypothetical protein
LMAQMSGGDGASELGGDRGDDPKLRNKRVRRACMYWCLGPCTGFVGHRRYIYDAWPHWSRCVTLNGCLVGWLLDLCALRELTVQRNLRVRLGPAMPKAKITRGKVVHPPKVKVKNDEDMMRYDMRSASFRKAQKVRRKSLAVDAHEKLRRDEQRKRRAAEKRREENMVKKMEIRRQYRV